MSQVSIKDPDLNNLLNILNEELKDLATKIYIDKTERVIYIEVAKEKILDLAKKMLHLGFDHVKSVSAVDYPQEKKIELMIHVGSYLRVIRKYTIIIRSMLERDNPRVSSLTSVWPSAEFHERETWEMFGVYFEGHPDLRRLLLPEELEGKWPMRKDFRIATRKAGEAEAPWK